jgi:hypothetical protein
MNKHHHDDADDLHFEQIRHSEIQYEDRDLGSRAIISFMVVLVIAAAVLCLAVWGYYDYYVKASGYRAPAARAERTEIDVPPGYVPPTDRFPKPALQTDEVAEMNKFLAEENTILNSYGRVDQNSGFIHIPIDQAIKTVAKQGLPARPAAPQVQAAQFGSGEDNVPGAGGGTRPETRR